MDKLLLILGIALPGVVSGQAVPTCGWHYLDAVEQAASVTEILADKPPTAAVSAAAEKLVEWYHNCDATAARVAAQLLRRERGRTNSTDPQLLGLLGVVLLRGPEVQVERAPGHLLRPALQESNAASEGMRLLHDVLSRRRWPEAAEEMAAVALAIRKEDYLKTALETLRLGEYAEDERLSALRAELFDALGHRDSARAIVAGRPHALHLRLSAVLSPRDGSAQQAYLQALAEASQPDLHVFYDDIRLILAPEELKEWSSVAPANRAAWLKGRWEWRAMLGGISVADRLAEHHYRIDVAKRRYPRKSLRGAPPTNAAWLATEGIANQPFDDRGLILLRHGEPTKVIQNRESPIAWFYGGVGPGPGVFEFAKDRSDYVLIEPTPLCVGNKHVLTKGKPTGYTTVRDHILWAMELLPYDKHLAYYYEACGRGSVLAEGRYLAERRQARAANRTVIATETAVPRFAEPIEGTFNLYEFQNGASAELVAYVGIPLASLTSREAAGARNHALAIRMAAGNLTTHQISVADSVVRFALPAVPAQNAVAGVPLSLPVQTGTSQRVVISVINVHDSAQGQVMSGVRDSSPQPNGIVISDIVVAHDREGTWQRGGESLLPAIGHSVAAGALTRLYYELYGLKEETTVNIQIQITPSREASILADIASWVRRRGAVSLSFQDHVQPNAAGTVPLLQAVRVDLEPGQYVLSIRVTNPKTGDSTEAETAVVVREAGT